jgi:hypothetical protein
MSPRSEQPERARVCLGDTVEDTGSKKIGKAMGFEGPYVRLRSIGGGRESGNPSGQHRRLTLTEALIAGLAAANVRSRGECP